MALAFFRFVIGLVVIGSWSLYRRIPLRLRRGELPSIASAHHDFYTPDYHAEYWDPIHVSLPFDYFH